MTRLACALPLLACLLGAQQPPSEGVQSRPVPPIFKALDTNQDGVISAAELANAPAALRTLDLNGDGVLSPDEYRPTRPGEQGFKARKQGPGSQTGLKGSGQGMVAAEPGRETPAEGGHGPFDQGQEGQPAPMAGDQRPPRPLLDLALDLNGDEIIDASEIANATALLKKLDVNGDGKLSREECLGKPNTNKGGKGGQR